MAVSDGLTVPASGRSAVWVENNVIGIREVPVAAPGPGEVLVRIRAAGICGSDLHGFHSEGARRHIPGIGPGHELAGEVAALGPGDTFQIGAEIYVVRGEPLRDAERLVWSAEVRLL